jgi:hypothetical protein
MKQSIFVNMKILTRVFFVSIIFLLCCNFVPAQKYTSLITGRVVDDKGNPVPRAMVVLESLTKNEIDDYAYNDTTFTGEDGKFKVINISTEKNRTRNLYISGPFPENAIPLVELPPWDNLRRLKPDLLVRPVKLNENFLTEIGDIKPKVYAGITEIILVNSNGEPYFKTEGDWQSVYYVLRGEDGEPVIAQGISINDTKLRINTKEGLIRFAVAEGTWTVEFISDLGDYKSIIAATKPFTVKKSETPLQIKVVSETR